MLRVSGPMRRTSSVDLSYSGNDVVPCTRYNKYNKYHVQGTMYNKYHVQGTMYNRYIVLCTTGYKAVKCAKF